MKKALIVSNSSGLVTLFLRNDIELLIERGYEIDCACNTNYPDSNTVEFIKQYDIHVTHIDFPIRDLDLNKVKKSYGSLKELLRGKYELIHCHSTIAAALTRQAAKKLRNNGTKIIYTSHGFPFYEGASGKKVLIYKMIENYYSKYTDAIITICEEDYENAKKMHCNHVYKINGVGIDLTRFNLNNRYNGMFDREKYRGQLGFESKDVVILSIGELNTNKNHQIIIRALSEINDQSFVYAICGREVTEVGKKDELNGLAKSLGVRLVFLGFRKDIPEVCACADIGAIPSFKEGLGLSGVEMLASGIPVVGSRRQGIKDYVIDGETGYLADPNVPSSFAETIRKTLDLKEKETTSVRCREVAAQYSVEKSRNVIDRVYSEVL